MNPNELLHRLGILVGVVVLGGGIVLVFIPDVALALPFNLLLADVAALGAVILGVWTARTRYRTNPAWVQVPDIEFPLATPTPGDELDDLIYRLTRLREGTIEHRERIFERLREVAIAVIQQREKASPEEAANRLESGTWTDDERARAFFASEGKGGRPSLRRRLKGRFMAIETAYERRLDAAVSALERLGGYGTAEVPEEEPERVRAMDPVHARQDETGERITETVSYRQLLHTHHWVGMSAFAFAALAVGLIASRPAVLMASALGIALAGYARLGPAPELAGLEVTRSVSDPTPAPGEELEVTVTIENAGETWLPDLRVIDRVPPMMEVIDGSPRLATALRPGEEARLQYQVVPERGEYAWPVQAIGRDVAGSLEREALIETATTVRCVPRLRSVVEMPARVQTSAFAGEMQTETGGEGLEFYSVRDYQPSDPLSRIDWKSFAKTGEFTTVDLREERAAKVVLLFDGRPSSYVSTRPGEKHALEMAIDAAAEIFASLYDRSHLIGIAAFNGIPCWLGPGTGATHVERVRNLFVTHPALSPLPPALAEEEEGRYVDPMVHIRRQLPSNTQIFLLSPLTDHFTYEVARQLNGAGHLITIISPDPTNANTIGQRIARLERIVRIEGLRNHGIRVIDWEPDRPLALELQHARKRWSA